MAQGYKLRSPALVARLAAAPRPTSKKMLKKKKPARASASEKLTALLRAEGLDQEARLVAPLFADLKLTPRRLARALRQPLLTIGTFGLADTAGSALAEWLKEGEPAIQIGDDWFRAVVLFGGEPLALGPMRELERNAKADAFRAADALAPDDLPALGTKLEYRGPAFSSRERGTLDTGVIGLVTELRREATDANPWGSALVSFPGGMRLVYRPHMKWASTHFKAVAAGKR